MRKALHVVACLLTLVAPAVAAQEVLDRLDQGLHFESESGGLVADLGVLADVEAYYIDQRPPAILVSDDDVLWNPRVTLLLDTFLGKYLYGFVQARFDRGFDPGVAREMDARVDEYFLRYMPFRDGRFSFQAGKFATVVGNWVQRHDSWHNGFINAPLPYENITTIGDHFAHASAAELVALRDLYDPKALWLPVIWGPAYTTGMSVSGLVGRFDYAVELKNAPISSRPYVWDAFEQGLDHPTWSARLGWRPDAAWRLGASYSQGVYLIEEASPTLPLGRNFEDYEQRTLVFDLAWSRRHWEVWGEVFLSSFEVPGPDDADTLAYYLEARYGIDPHWSVGARWNHQLFNEVDNGTGGESRWDRNTWRADTVLGYRFNRHWQAKLQYSYTKKDGPLQQGEQNLSMQLTLKF